MKTVKTTLIVIGTLLGVYILISFGVWIWQMNEYAKWHDISLYEEIKVRNIVSSRSKEYSFKLVTIDNESYFKNDKTGEITVLKPGEKVIFYNCKEDKLKRFQATVDYKGEFGKVYVWDLKEFNDVAEVLNNKKASNN